MAVFEDILSTILQSVLLYELGHGLLLLVVRDWVCRHTSLSLKTSILANLYSLLKISFEKNHEI